MDPGNLRVPSGLFYCIFLNECWHCGALDVVVLDGAASDEGDEGSSSFRNDDLRGLLPTFSDFCDQSDCTFFCSPIYYLVIYYFDPNIFIGQKDWPA